MAPDAGAHVEQARHRYPIRNSAEQRKGSHSVGKSAAPNPSIERTVSSGLRPPPTAAHVKR